MLADPVQDSPRHSSRSSQPLLYVPTPLCDRADPRAQISYAVYDLTKKALFAREELESQREHDSQEE